MGIANEMKNAIANDYDFLGMKIMRMSNWTNG